jgi:lysine 6-dehydrogenase
MRITVLGSGLVGSAIVRDLVREKSCSVTAVDVNEEALAKLRAAAATTTVQADVREPGRIAALAAGCDLMVCAVPGFMGFETLKRVIEAGRNVVDISFFAEDPFLLDDLARAKNVTAVVDCGVAPGLCNIIAGRVATLLERVERYVCYVGGLPKIRCWPYEYRAVFSPRDVLEEYTRPARMVEGGEVVVRPALSDVELLDFAGVGTLEAFNTDGLRSLMRTLPAPFMKEKTLRYPGHANLMRVFRQTGFFNPAPIEVEGARVSPLAVTSRLLFDEWRMGKEDEDVTILQVTLEGCKGEKRVRHTFDLFDQYDRATHTTSMARTTGYTCAIVARQVASGLFNQKGICPPEFVGRVPGCYDNLMAECDKRGISVKETIAAVS